MALPDKVESGDGRIFTLQEVDPGGMLDLLEAAGTASGSAAWMSYAAVVCSVVAIDGKPVLMPNTKEGVKDLARRIGNTGIVALFAAYNAPSDTPASPDAEAQVAKN